MELLHIANCVYTKVWDSAPRRQHTASDAQARKRECSVQTDEFRLLTHCAFQLAYSPEVSPRSPRSRNASPRPAHQDVSQRPATAVRPTTEKVIACFTQNAGCRSVQRWGSCGCAQSSKRPETAATESPRKSLTGHLTGLPRWVATTRGTSLAVAGTARVADSADSDDNGSELWHCAATAYSCYNGF